MSDALVKVAGFLNPVEAELSQNYLEEHGIRCLLDNVAMTYMAWQYAGATGGIKLLVRAEDLPRAEQLLAELKEEFDAAPSTADLEDDAEEAPGTPATTAQEAGKIPAGQSSTIDAANSPPANKTDSDENDLWLNPREELVERGYRATVLALYFFPLLFYATWMLLCASDDEYPLSKREESRLRWAWRLNIALWVVLGPLLYFLIYEFTR